MDGAFPAAAPVFDPTGTFLYGTTSQGGARRRGTVFKTEIATGATTVIHSFETLRGGFFLQAGVTIDKSGMLYGATTSIVFAGGGAVYKLDPATGAFTVLHSFVGNQDGFFPSAPVTLDAQGNIFGTTLQGGGNCDPNKFALFCGTVFRIDHGTSNLTILHAFNDTDGNDILNGLLLAPDGQLYGMAFEGGVGCGGVDNCGTIFKVDPSSGQFAVVHDFLGPPTDGAFPTEGDLTLGKDGMIYGATQVGGTKDGGVLFRLDPTTEAVTILHDFIPAGQEGLLPRGTLAVDANGVLYGETATGGLMGDLCPQGNGAGCGTIFSFDPASGTFTTLHRFRGGHEGVEPSGGLLIDARGVLFGTTLFGGSAADGGTVFALEP
jgi:uncharacterized repeat protein (TIGR03803 family)